MFTWICQQCGREVPPSYSECPTCAERKAAAAGVPPPPPLVAPQPAAPPPLQQQPAYYAPAPPPPQATYTPPAPAAAPRPQAAAARSGMPSWLVAVLAFAGLGVILASVYYFRSNGGGKRAATAPAALEQPSVPAAGAAAHPYANYLEVTGIRLMEEGAKVRVRFSAVNHSAADMAGLAIKGELVASSAQGDDAAVASFESKIGNLGPYESKDFTVPAATKLRAYELPDWQFMKARFQITSPK